MFSHREELLLQRGGSGTTPTPKDVMGQGQTDSSRARIKGRWSMGFPQLKPHRLFGHPELFQFCCTNIFQFLFGGAFLRFSFLKFGVKAKIFF